MTRLTFFASVAPVACVVPVVSVALGGCAVGQSDAPDAEAQASSTATAIVVVERTTGPADVTRDAIVARFVRVRQGAVDDPALRTAGVQDLPAAGTCVTSLDAQDAQPFAARSVELLDVGVVTVDAAQATPSKTTTLLPRAMPDPAGVVSGYFYSASARGADMFAPNTRVLLRAGGGHDLPEGFAVNVVAPRDLADVRVSPTSIGLDVAWELTPDASDARDLVYVDVLAPSVVARCAAIDTGRLIVPIALVPAVEEGQVVVHRVHREPFRARGIDPGEVRFDLARVVAFKR